MEPSTLDEVIKTKAGDWTDETAKTIIEGYILAMKTWDLEQQKGSRKLVQSKKIKVKKNARSLARNLKKLRA